MSITLLQELRILGDSISKPDKRKKLKRIILSKDLNRSLVFELQTINDSLSGLHVINDELPAIKQKLADIAEIRLIKGDKGTKGDSIIGKTGKTGPRGDKPVAGIDYRIPKDGNSIKGDQGTPGVRGEIGKIGENGKPPKHEVQNNSIRFENPDGSWGEWIHLESLLGSGKTLHRGGLSMVVDDLYDQCDGVNQVFILSNSYEPGTVTVQSSQFPIIFRPVIDFIETGQKEITLVTSQVGPIQADQTLIITYSKNGN